MEADVGTLLEAEVRRIVTCPYPTQLKVCLCVANRKDVAGPDD